MSPRREYALALGLLALGAFLLLVALTKSWTIDTVALLEGVTPSRSRTVSGASVAPAAAAAAWIALAGIAGLVATRSWGRTLVGLVLVLAAVAGILSALRAWTAPWAPVAIVGLVCPLVAGLLAIIHGRRWPVLGSRYERQAEPRQEADERATWDALDRGEDPTA